MYLDAKTRKIAERQEEKPIDKVVENIKTGKGKIPGIHKRRGYGDRYPHDQAACRAGREYEYLAFTRESHRC